MNPVEFRDRILLPGAAFTEQTLGFRSDENALQIIMTTAGQESAWKHRYQLRTDSQVLPGPARGFWQFELGDSINRGGITGLFIHQRSGPWLRKLCETLAIYPDPITMHRAVEGNDLFAYALARINYIVNDPLPIPSQRDAAWETYKKVWRPGKPKPETWPDRWAAASAAMAA